MEMRNPHDEEGQSSIYDAMMFLSIMLVASASIIGVSNYLLRADDVRSFEELENYSARYANAVLSSTVPNATYIDGLGSNVTSQDISVRDMIIEELVLLRSGVPEENFGGSGGYDERIAHVLSSLLDTDRFQARLCGRYGVQEVAFGSESEPAGHKEDIAANTARISMPEAENDILIVVYVWWK